jgi:hypothetical protein
MNDLIAEPRMKRSSQGDQGMDRRIWAAVIGASAMLAPQMAGQTPAEPTSRPHAGGDPPATAPQMEPAGETSPVRTAGRRLPLLRQGSQLVGVTGLMRRDPATGSWRIMLNPLADQAPRYELIMLPCTLLGEIERIAQSVPGPEVVFEVTGTVYVYRGRNYLLPTHAPRVAGYEPPSSQTPDAHEGENEQTTNADDDSARAIMRQLERAVGPVARSTATEAVRAPATDSSKLLREGTVLLDRRGRLRRDEGGAWMFIFDADAEGLADPPMILLPCLLLERMEQYARIVGSDPPLLVSGHVHVYGGRNYLLPTVYRIPRERTPLEP